jgi:hypothetical protein
LEHSTALNNDFDRAADDEAEVAVGAAAINGDFGKAVRILIPERRAGRPIAEGCCALEGPRRHRSLAFSASLDARKPVIALPKWST